MLFISRSEACRDARETGSHGAVAGKIGVSFLWREDRGQIVFETRQVNKTALINLTK